MKRILFLFLSWIVFLTSSHAQIAVADFHLAPNDLTAVTHGSEVKDQNGETCALIKVETTQQGFAFDGGMLGVTEVRQKVGEIWVYVPHALNRITIQHQRLGILRDYFFPIPVERGKTYIMKLTTGTVETIVNPGITQQFVVFSVTPKNAAVTLDGEPLPVSDGTASKLMPFGRYDYRVEHADYHPQAGKVEVSDPVNTVELNVALKPAFGWIEVSGSSAQGATVFIDNVQQGTAPFRSGNIRSGSHSVKVVRPLYKSFTTTVTVSDNQTTKLTPALEPNFAHLTLRAENPQTEIWVNGRKMGTGSVTDDFELGTLIAESRLPSHRDSRQQIAVTPALHRQTITLMSPTPIYGTLVVTSTPLGADIALDGQSVGRTPRQLSQTLVGQHEITLSKEGYATERRTVTVTEGQTATVSATLANGCPVRITAGKQGARIFVDGQKAGTSPYSGTLSFGRHTLYAEADGKRSQEQEVTIRQGETATRTIELSFSDNRTFTVNGVSFEMVYVEGGTFTMGATPEQGSDAYDDEKPTHSVTLSSYYIGQTEVTQALWKAVMGSNPSNWKGDDLPVEKVSRDDCQEFVRKLNSLTGKTFRLPTEAEWEYAARGGKKSRGYKYSGSDFISSVAWYSDNSGDMTHAVATKSPNELGLYDMSGNVWEWCQDWRGGYSSSAQTNPTGASSGGYRVYRGGCWSYGARSCRVSSRITLTPELRNSFLGLRLALVP